MMCAHVISKLCRVVWSPRSLPADSTSCNVGVPLVAGQTVSLYVEDSATLAPAAFAVRLQVRSAAPGHHVAITAVLRHVVTSDYDDQRDNDFSLLLLQDHVVPALDGAFLDLNLAGAAPRVYNAAVQRGTMQPAEGNSESVAAALGTVDTQGWWALDIVNAGTEEFSGSVDMTLVFEATPPAVPVLAESELCWCAGGAPAVTASFSEPAPCRPLMTTGSTCDAAAPLQGYTVREAQCMAQNGQPAGLQECYSADCALGLADRAALRGAGGRTALLPTSCAFYDSCIYDYKYEPGKWSECSAPCWADTADASSKPYKQRQVLCYKVEKSTGKMMAVNVQVPCSCPVPFVLQRPNVTSLKLVRCAPLE